MTRQGFSLVEIIVAAAILLIVVATFGGALIFSQGNLTVAGERIRAQLIVEEAMEAVHNIRDEAFGNLTDGTYGLALIGNQWTLSGSSDTIDGFIREVEIESINATTKRVTTTVRWVQNIQRAGEISSVATVTYWPREVNQAQDLFVDVSGASLDSSQKRIIGITLENSGLSNLVIFTITSSWSSGNLIEGIAIGGTNVWRHNAEGTPDGRQPTDTVLDIVDYTLPVGSGVINIDSIGYNGIMAGDTITILLTMEDATTKQFTVFGGGDSTPPATVTDLAITDTAATSVDLSWTAPGDDGSVGTATTYDIRYSTSAISDANWGAATPVTGEPSPSSAGSSESMTVSSLLPDTTYFFALKTSDEVPNESALSNVPSTTTLSPTEAEFLIVDTSGANIGGGSNKELQGITVGNSGPSSITIDTITVTWDNVNLIEEIEVGGIRVWRFTGPGVPSGRQLSGTEIDIVNFVITSGATDPIDKIKLNGSMIGATFSITFKMLDGSMKTATNISP